MAPLAPLGLLPPPPTRLKRVGGNPFLPPSPPPSASLYMADHPQISQSQFQPQAQGTSAAGPGAHQTGSDNSDNDSTPSALERTPKAKRKELGDGNSVGGGTGARRKRQHFDQEEDDTVKWGLVRTEGEKYLEALEGRLSAITSGALATSTSSPFPPSPSLTSSSINRSDRGASPPIRDSGFSEGLSGMRHSQVYGEQEWSGSEHGLDAAEHEGGDDSELEQDREPLLPELDAVTAAKQGIDGLPPRSDNSACRRVRATPSSPPPDSPSTSSGMPSSPDPQHDSHKTSSLTSATGSEGSASAPITPPSPAADPARSPQALIMPPAEDDLLAENGFTVQSYVAQTHIADRSVDSTLTTTTVGGGRIRFAPTVRISGGIRKSKHGLVSPPQNNRFSSFEPREWDDDGHHRRGRDRERRNVRQGVSEFGDATARAIGRGAFTADASRHLPFNLPAPAPSPVIFAQLTPPMSPINRPFEIEPAASEGKVEVEQQRVRSKSLTLPTSNIHAFAVPPRSPRSPSLERVASTSMLSPPSASRPHLPHHHHSHGGHFGRPRPLHSRSPSGQSTSSLHSASFFALPTAAMGAPSAPGWVSAPASSSASAPPSATNSPRPRSSRRPSFSSTHSAPRVHYASNHASTSAPQPMNGGFTTSTHQNGSTSYLSQSPAPGSTFTRSSSPASSIYAPLRPPSARCPRIPALPVWVEPGARARAKKKAKERRERRRKRAQRGVMGWAGGWFNTEDTYLDESDEDDELYEEYDEYEDDDEPSTSSAWMPKLAQWFNGVWTGKDAQPPPAVADGDVEEGLASGEDCDELDDEECYHSLVWRRDNERKRERKKRRALAKAIASARAGAESTPDTRPGSGVATPTNSWTVPELAEPDSPNGSARGVATDLEAVQAEGEEAVGGWARVRMWSKVTREWAAKVWNGDEAGEATETGPLRASAAPQTSYGAVEDYSTGPARESSFNRGLRSTSKVAYHGALRAGKWTAVAARRAFIFWVVTITTIFTWLAANSVIAKAWAIEKFGEARMAWQERMAQRQGWARVADWNPSPPLQEARWRTDRQGSTMVSNV